MEFNMKYTQKQIEIFEGVMKLIQEGRKLHELKVADITESAGMGKSTAYEYFSSKEEIIKEALVYHLNKNFSELIEYIDQGASFDGMLKNAMDYLEECMEKRFTGIFLLLLMQKHEKSKDGLCLEEDLQKNLEEVILFQIEKTFYEGRSEGFINEEMSFEDIRMVIFGLFSAYVQEMLPFKMKGCSEGKSDQEIERKNIEIKKIKERTVRLIKKTLA